MEQDEGKENCGGPSAWGRMEARAGSGPSKQPSNQLVCIYLFKPLAFQAFRPKEKEGQCVLSLVTIFPES